MMLTTTLKRAFWGLVFLCCNSNLAFANFDFNSNCVNIYTNIVALKLGPAKQLLQAEKKLRPNNAITTLLDNYWDYFYLITVDSKAEYDRLHALKDARLNLIAGQEKNSPYYLYAQAEINLQWGILSGRFGNNYTAAREINKASNLLQQNNKKFPAYILNQKGLGLINAVLGAMPDGFLKSALATFGIKGNLNMGLGMLERLLDGLPTSNFDIFYEEVLLYYMFAITDVAHSPNAYSNVIKYATKASNSSLLKTYIQAYVSNKTGHADQTLKVLDAKPLGANYQAFPFLTYLEGIAKLNKLDLSSSAEFVAFLRNSKGDSFVKDTYLHLGWIALLRGQDSLYDVQMNKAKSAGDSYLERDKQAVNEANAQKPNAGLLKARLLFDGGYLSRSLETLLALDQEDLSTPKDKTEYHYRLARVYDDLGNDSKALPHYLTAVNQGKNLKYYYAAKSAVLAGKIYAKQKNAAMAKQCFNQAIAMQDHEYENSIENEAKIALRAL